MSVFNQSRRNVIRLIFISMIVIIIVRLFTLQVFSSKYKIMADDQGMFRKVVYPDRGIIYDRKNRPILRNTIIYDLMVTPGKIRGTDTAMLCNILDIDTAEFRKRIITAIIKNKSYRPSIFEALLSEEKMAKLNENMYRFAPGYYLQERPVRDYPYDAGGNILGYLSEVDTNFLKRHPDEGYVSGDYAGKTGLELSYEKVLMGKRGIEYYKRDNKNRLTDRWENGEYDTIAVAGQNMHTYLDIELQELGERLMENKVGAVVAIDPKTGGILAMVSAPTYKPRLLTGAERKKHYTELLLDPRIPFLNRTIGAKYSPGSTFKTLQGLIGLQEGVVTSTTNFSCSGAFYGCGKPMRCLDPGVWSLKGAITHSCNTYFANVMQRVINNPKYPSIDSALNAWAGYMHAFGLGKKLGVDLPSEKGGSIPSAKTYNKIYGEGRWNFCTFRSVSIGQGEVETTILQVANEMAYLANKGWYITPHLVDSIEGGDEFNLLAPYRQKHIALNIPDTLFEQVHDGMQGVMDGGTGRYAQVPGVVVCGKTGTVENSYKGVKQKDHAFFAAFAPRDNPQIAIAVICENAGFGSTSAAPIASLMIEKYLKDSIVGKERNAKADQIAKMNLLPPRLVKEIRTRDSIMHRRDSAYLMAKGYIKMVKDTTGLENDDVETADLDKIKKEKPAKKKSAGDTANLRSPAILPTDKKRSTAADSTRNI
ncbi:MAG: penicillin-binding protein 2 [Chitinophagaceae bacterium]|nr:MAG: penicillin-binding protein 2 [Chitinophagaceae bacterium]